MHLERLPSGRWRAIVQVGGRRRSVTRPTRGEAHTAGARLAIELGATPTGGTVTVDDLIDAHLASPRLRETSRERYRYTRRHIPDHFTTRPVPTVTPPVIDALYRSLEARLPAREVRRIHSLLSGAFTRAVRMGWVPVNPCRDAELPVDPGSDTKVPTTAEARALLTACDTISSGFGLYCRTVANTGLRRGQVLALTHHDIDGDRITVGPGVTWTPRTGLIVDDAKTGRHEHRTITVGQGLAARLATHMAAQAAELPGYDGWLFTANMRTPWFPNTVNRWWRDARTACGIDGVRIHDLRAYVVTEGFAAGLDVRTVMGRVGHRRLATSVEHYAVARDARDRALAEHLENELGA